MRTNHAIQMPDSAWWGYVSGPSLLVHETADALIDGKNVCICAPDSLPWRDSFLEHVANAAREVEESLLFETLHDVTDDPGRRLVEHFGLEASYRPTKAYADFFRERRSFAGRVLYMAATEGDAMRRWFEFEKDYKTTSVHDGLVLLETRTVLPDNAPVHVQVFVYDDFVSEYDALVFAGLMLPDNKMNIEQKKYLSTLAVSLFATNAEGVADFVGAFQFDRRALEQSANGIDLSGDDLTRRVWNAQVQTLFPLIMKECREFIYKWHDKIVDAFNYANVRFSNGLLDTNRNPVESPDAMELSTICYLMRKRRLDSHGYETEDYILYIPDENDRARIELLYEMRNRIAHGKVCRAEEVGKLLNLER
jgi:hypothetical protein